MIELRVDIPHELAPAFRAMVEDMSKKYAGLAELQHLPAVERSRTKAVAAIGLLRKAVTEQIKRPDKDFA